MKSQSAVALVTHKLQENFCLFNKLEVTSNGKWGLCSTKIHQDQLCQSHTNSSNNGSCHSEMESGVCTGQMVLLNGVFECFSSLCRIGLIEESMHGSTIAAIGLVNISLAGQRAGAQLTGNAIVCIHLPSNANPTVTLTSHTQAFCLECALSHMRLTHVEKKAWDSLSSTHGC